MTVAGSNNRLTRFLERFGLWAVVIFFVLYSISPFYWAINTSFKTPVENNQSPATPFPEDPTLANYNMVLNDEVFIRSIVNSAATAFGATMIAVVFGGLAAYALGRYNFRGRSLMRYLILLMTLFPTIAVLPSLFNIITSIGLNGSILSLILTYPMFTLPITTMPMIVFFRNLPQDIEQAAYIDGASTLQMFSRILLPISLPVLFTSGFITFVGVWSEYLLALAFTSANQSSWTVTVAIKFLASQFTAGQMMAAAMILSLPLIIAIFITQRQFVSNKTEGAVKG